MRTSGSCWEVLMQSMGWIAQPPTSTWGSGDAVAWRGMQKAANHRRSGQNLEQIPSKRGDDAWRCGRDLLWASSRYLLLCAFVSWLMQGGEG